MKILSAAVLLAASALVNAFDYDSPEAERRYSRFLEEDIAIVPRDIVAYKVDPDDLSSETAFCVTVGMGQGTTKCVPPSSESGSEGRRRLKIKPKRSRRTEELSITRPSKETGLVFTREITVEIENVDVSKSPSVVFTGVDDNTHTYTFELSEDDNIGEGVSVQILGGLLPGDYTMALVDADGKELIALGESITVGPPSEAEIERTVGTTSSTGVVAENHYTKGGQVTQAAGRIYFSVKGKYYGCSGSAIYDKKSGRSLVLTAAHCVFADEDHQWAFGSDAIFIPNRNAVKIKAGTTGKDIHMSCTKDICGCWKLSGGVVHDKWPDTPWPARLSYDYGFYVVKDYGMHSGTVCRSTTALDVAVDELEFAFDAADSYVGTKGYGFGYSLYYNPFFRYCTDTVTIETATLKAPTAWIPSCLLSGGASGGPWMMNFDEATGKGNLVTVTSWSKNYADGNGGPFISEPEARCLINAARGIDFAVFDSAAAGDAGLFANCYDRPCVTAEELGGGRMLRGGRELCGHDYKLIETGTERRQEEEEEKN